MTETLYNSEFYAGLAGARKHNERALWALYAVLGRPRSFCDFGCGDGWLVHMARTSGVLTSIGVEVSEDALDFVPLGTEIIVHDLNKSCDLGHSFDLVISWEVGEHLPIEAADIFASTLVIHTDKYLVFTAAQVGQGGYHHVNCQQPEYWREKIELRGLNYDPALTEQVRNVWMWVVGPLRYLVDNVQVFVRA